MTMTNREMNNKSKANAFINQLKQCSDYDAALVSLSHYIAGLSLKGLSTGGGVYALDYRNAKAYAFKDISQVGYSQSFEFFSLILSETYGNICHMLDTRVIANIGLKLNIHIKFYNLENLEDAQVKRHLYSFFKGLEELKPFISHLCRAIYNSQYAQKRASGVDWSGRKMAMLSNELVANLQEEVDGHLHSNDIHSLAIEAVKLLRARGRKLTATQKAITIYMIAGYTDSMIAKRVGIARQGVQRHRQNIYKVFRSEFPEYLEVLK